MMPTIILASASPQRKELLAGLGLSFQVVPSFINEADCSETDPPARAIHLARLKAEDVATNRAGDIVIGCDTLVVSASGELLEKPRDEREARSMLEAHTGKTSLVHSALCVIDAQGKKHEGLSSSSVTFKKLSAEEVDWWIDSGLWRDRSGGFQIDGLGQLMIERIEGDWTSIVGLPVFLLGSLFDDILGKEWKIK